MIDLLVVIVVVPLASQWVKRASILVWVPFVVAFGASIEIWATRLIAMAFGALALASPIMVRAIGVTAASQRIRVGWGRVLDLADLDLGHFSVRGDLLNF